MKENKFPSTPHQYEILRCAVHMAYVDDTPFTFKTFAVNTGLKENRHLAAALNAMAYDGLLLRLLITRKDGKGVFVFMAAPHGKRTESWLEKAQLARKIIDREDAENTDNRTKGQREIQENRAVVIESEAAS